MKFQFLLLPILLATSVARAAAPERPNILFIFSDDQRADTIRALGNNEITTPNLDRLVRGGVSFSRAYCMGGLQGAVCVPSRAMLMTGRSLFRIDEQMKAQGTWPEQFGKAGWQTFATGKWHNGAESLLRSFQTGSALFLGGMGDPYHLPLQDFGPDRKLVKRAARAGTHAVEAIADAAVDFLEKRDAAKPFLAYVAMEAPHDPRIAPPQFHAKYNAAKPSLPKDFMPLHPFDNGEMTIRDEKLAEWPRTPDEIRQHLADYYAMIEFMDQQIGRILDTLKKSGCESNTLVVFASDQGLAVGSHGLMGKQNLYESGMRVPLIIGGPGIPSDVRTDAMCHLLDVFPTIGAMTGVSKPEGSEGLDLSPVLRGSTKSARTEILTAYRDVQRAIRDDRWKLIRYPQIDRTQLFDLSADPHEMNDLSAKPEQSARVGELMGLLARTQKVHGDSLPLTVANPKSGEWTPPAPKSKRN